MNTPDSVQIKIKHLLDALPRFTCYQFADASAERQRVKAILQKILELRNEAPLLSAFEEKILAKAMNVYDAYTDPLIQRKQAGEIIIRPLHTIASIQPELIQLENGDTSWIKSVLRTRYSLTIPDDLILKLEGVRDCHFRIRLEQGYTDPANSDLFGMAHSEQFDTLPEGYLRRSADGQPFLFATTRSSSPIPLAMEEVVRLEFANKIHGGELWRHPAYKLNDGCISIANQDGLMVRAGLMTQIARNQFRLQVKIYDGGKLVLHKLNLPASSGRQFSADAPVKLPISLLLEFLTNLLASKTEGTAATTDLIGDLSWLKSERHRQLLTIVKSLQA